VGVVRAYQPGDRCPPAWVDADGLVRVALTRTSAASTMVDATIRSGEPVTRACAAEVEPELRARRLIL
jgi:hypothetical protein